MTPSNSWNDIDNSGQQQTPPTPQLPQAQPSQPQTDPAGAALNQKTLANTPLDEILTQRLLMTPGEFEQKRMDEIFGTGKKGAAGRLLQGLLSGAAPLKDRIQQEYNLYHSQLATLVQKQEAQARITQMQAQMQMQSQRYQMQDQTKRLGLQIAQDKSDWQESVAKQR